jgi:hypothetical protein
MTIKRGVGLFEPEAPPLAAEKPLAAGQPGRTWKRYGSDGWSVDCKDGTRATTGNGTARVRFQPRKP